MVAGVPMTPMRPVRLALAAAAAVASTTPVYPTGKDAAQSSGRVLETVPHAAMMNLTPLRSKNAMSCLA